MSTYQLFVIATFLAVVLFLEGAYLAWNAHRGPAARRIRQRLQALATGAAGPTASLVKQRMLAGMPALDRLLAGLPRARLLDRLLEQAGSRMSVAAFLGWSVAAALAAVVLGLMGGLPPPFAVMAGAAAALLPLLHVMQTRRQRLEKIEQQLPEVLDLMARALRAGHALHSSLQMVASEGPEPAASEFRITFDEINFGVATPDALANLALRVPIDDLRYFVIAVLIQRETGGNLAELLGNIATLVRERLKLMGTVRVLSAEGRLSAWILTLLPFALAAVINVVNPGFISVLWTDRTGLNMVVGAAAMMVVGIFWMWRIVKIRV